MPSAPNQARDDIYSNKVLVLLNLVDEKLTDETQDGVWNSLYTLLQKSEKGEDGGIFRKMLELNITKILVGAVIDVDPDTSGGRTGSISSMFWSLDTIVCLMRVLHQSPYQESPETGENWKYLRNSLPTLIEASSKCYHLFDGTMGGPVNTFRIRTAECLFLILNSAGAGRAPNASPVPHVTACMKLMSKIWWKLLERALKESNALSEKVASILAHCSLDLYERRLGTMDAQELMGNDHRHIVNHYVRLTNDKFLSLDGRIAHFQLITSLAVLDATPSFMRAIFSRKVLRRSISLLEETLRERKDRFDVHDVAMAAWNELCRVAILEHEWRITSDAVVSGLFPYMFKWSQTALPSQLKQCKVLIVKISLGASLNRDACMEAGRQLARIICDIPSVRPPVRDDVKRLWGDMHQVYAGVAKDSHQAHICSAPTCTMPWSKSGGTLSTCSRCKSVLYCSSDCQKADWKSHKPSCVPPT